ncbi:MAG: hypothetical protein U1F77_14135 [Kiritimatiellia bacterium]
MRIETAGATANAVVRTRRDVVEVFVTASTRTWSAAWTPSGSRWPPGRSATWRRLQTLVAEFNDSSVKPVEPARLKGFLPREVPGLPTTTRTGGLWTGHRRGLGDRGLPDGGKMIHLRTCGQRHHEGPGGAWPGR